MDEAKTLLVGRVIVSTRLSPDGSTITLFTDDEQLIGTCCVECCSETWIEEVINLDALIDSPILDVQELDLPGHLRVPTRTGHFEDVMQYYGLQITTAKGACVIAYRNSSNGYYGGNLAWDNWRQR
jgi:hypothetical protein